MRDYGNEKELVLNVYRAFFISRAELLTPRIDTAEPIANMIMQNRFHAVVVMFIAATTVRPRTE